jgi:cold shock CspA family protein
MNGALLWFNEHKSIGMIETDDGDRVPVARAAFVHRDAPVGRCAGTRVAFDVGHDGERQVAVNVVRVSTDAPPRARRRRTGQLR